MASQGNDNESSSKPSHVLIAGAGVVGTSTAYYLAKDFGISSTLIDITGGIAPAASGKAGGFLALDWNDYSPIGPLTRRSFQLHQEIADRIQSHDQKDPITEIQYRRLTCAAISVASNNKPKGKKLEGVEWVEGDGVRGMRSMGTEDNIAQVHPKLLCQKLFQWAQELTDNKTAIVKGKVVGAVYEEENLADDPTAKKFIGAQLEDGTTVFGDALLYACGPWTCNLMSGVKYHSVIVPTPAQLSQCVFFSGYGDPEVYVRPDGTAYCTGFPDAAVQPVKERPGEEKIELPKIQQIAKSVEMASSMAIEKHSVQMEMTIGQEQTQKTQQACYLPCTPDNVPLMGKVPLHPQCYVAAGHSCWGILMGPATGESMAHLIGNGGKSLSSPPVDLRPFDPSRFGTSIEMVPS